MKFRNRFLKYGRTQLSDVFNAGESYKPNLYCFADDDNNDDDKGGADDDKGGAETVTLSKADLDALIAKAAKGGSDDKDDKDKSAYDDIEKERNKEKTEAEQLESTRKTVAFDLAFNGFVEKNKNSFSIDVTKFRESAKGLKGEELEQVLSATAAKDFFRKEENINILPERDREFIKANILPLADNAIDYRKAWQLIEDAIHIKNRVAENGQYRKNTQDSNIDNTDTPNVTAYLKKCADAGKPKSAA